MSRVTQFSMPIKNKSPSPSQYNIERTVEGKSLLTLKGKSTLQEQIRGTISRDGRFKDYNYNAFKRSNPIIGPGSHDDDINYDI
jgi:hypothetical protein